METIYEVITNTRPDGIVDRCIKATLPDGKEMFIPFDEGNSDYQAYLASQEEEK